jgi:uncharacterized protein YyaL (SSP411 family)
VFGRPEWLASARRAVAFLRTTLWDGERLLATYKDGRAHLNAYLDDYAFLLDALLELMQTAFDPADLELAEALAQALLERFEDRDRGGFFFTSHDHERLIHRPKPGHDNATPAGNGVAAFALGRLGHLTGDARFVAAAERAVAAFHPAMRRSPGGYGMFLAVLEEVLAPPRIVVLRGAPDSLGSWIRRLAGKLRPDTLVVGVPPSARGLAPVLDKPPSAAGGVNAYVCEGVTCLAPVADLPTLETLLAARRGAVRTG